MDVRARWTHRDGLLSGGANRSHVCAIGKDGVRRRELSLSESRHVGGYLRFGVGDEGMWESELGVWAWGGKEQSAIGRVCWCGFTGCCCRWGWAWIVLGVAACCAGWGAGGVQVGDLGGMGGVAGWLRLSIIGEQYWRGCGFWKWHRVDT